MSPNHWTPEKCVYLHLYREHNMDMILYAYFRTIVATSSSIQISVESFKLWYTIESICDSKYTVSNYALLTFSPMAWSYDGEGMLRRRWLQFTATWTNVRTVVYIDNIILNCLFHSNILFIPCMGVQQNTRFLQLITISLRWALMCIHEQDQAPTHTHIRSVFFFF